MLKFFATPIIVGSGIGILVSQKTKTKTPIVVGAMIGVGVDVALIGILIQGLKVMS